MQRRTLITNAVLVNEGQTFRGSVLIEDEHIERIITDGDATPSVAADQTISAEGCYLLPGVIDEHVHFRDPGFPHKASIRTESAAAAAGGVTTYLDMPNTLPQTTTEEAFADKLDRAARESIVNYGFFFGATRENANLLPRLNPHRVAGVKLFMGASTGNMLVDDDESLERIFEHCSLPLMVHCEDSAAIDRNMAQAQQQCGIDPPVALHSAIRSEEVCYTSTKKAVDLARRFSTRLHVAHVSTAKELSLFSPADAAITAEACLPHLLFTEADYPRLATRIKCNPSVKTAADRDALRRALSDGRIATIATDHAPHALCEKVGGATRAASGMPMVQFSLPAMLDLVDEGVLTIERLVQLMCHAPAQIFQIEGRGFLREGYKADLVVVRPHAPWTLTPNRIQSLCNWSPLEGHTFRWRIEQTFCNGFLIFNHGRITNEAFRGQPVTFER